MRLILFFLLLSLGADAQIIRANPFYRPTATAAQLLLDAYPNAAAAYSLRKLRSAYTGSAIRVRRKSDNTEQDIGFTNNYLDTSGLKTFVGTASTDTGFIVTFYDQANSNNVGTGTTAGPFIIEGGKIIYSNNYPALNFKSNNNFLQQINSNIFQNVSYGYAFALHRVTSTGVQRTIWSASTGTSTTTSRLAVLKNVSNKLRTEGRRLDADGTTSAIASLANLSTTNLTLSTHAIDWSLSNADQYINGSLDGSTTSWATDGNTSNTVSQRFRIGAPASNSFTGFFLELVIYNTDESANRTAIETNINNYYGL